MEEYTSWEEVPLFYYILWEEDGGGGYNTACLSLPPCLPPAACFLCLASPCVWRGGDWLDPRPCPVPLPTCAPCLPPLPPLACVCLPAPLCACGSTFPTIPRPRYSPAMHTLPFLFPFCYLTVPIAFPSPFVSFVLYSSSLLPLPIPLYSSPPPCLPFATFCPSFTTHHLHCLDYILLPPCWVPATPFPLGGGDVPACASLYLCPQGGQTGALPCVPYPCGVCLHFRTGPGPGKFPRPDRHLFPPHAALTFAMPKTCSALCGALYYTACL